MAYLAAVNDMSSIVYKELFVSSLCLVPGYFTSGM